MKTYGALRHQTTTAAVVAALQAENDEITDTALQLLLWGFSEACDGLRRLTAPEIGDLLNRPVDMIDASLLRLEAREAIERDTDHKGISSYGIQPPV